MTLSFWPGMSACAFITDGLYRYLKEHRGEGPVERVLRPEHKSALRDELHIPLTGIAYDGCWFNNIPVLEAPCCRASWLVIEDGRRWELWPYHRASWGMFLALPTVCALQRAQPARQLSALTSDLQERWS